MLLPGLQPIPIGELSYWQMGYSKLDPKGKDSLCDRMLNKFILLFILLSIGCGRSENKYDSGYNDGYAEGYNTTLEIRATLIEGDFDSKSYSAGYTDGRIDGVSAALIEKNKSKE